MNEWYFIVVFAAGLAVGVILFPLARMIESRGIDSFLDGLVRMLAIPFSFVRNVVRRKTAAAREAARKCGQTDTPRVDLREQQLDDTAQIIRGMLLSLAAAVQRTDKAASDSNEALDDIRGTLDQMALPGDLKDIHFLLLGEIDRMISSNCSLKSELVHSREVLSTQREQIESLKTAVRIDGMTQLANRAFFDEKLTEMTRLNERYRETFSLLLMDVDNFKKINDSYGHQGGDRVLKGVGFKIKSILRHTDFVARFGGDEFAVILVKAPVESAAEIARKLCRAIEDSRFILDGNEIRTTLSIGVAEAEIGENEDSLLRRADLALYQVKQGGRNGVSVAAKKTANVERA